jgi:hypothetical protein
MASRKQTYYATRGGPGRVTRWELLEATAARAAQFEAWRRFGDPDTGATVHDWVRVAVAGPDGAPVPVYHRAAAPGGRWRRPDRPPHASR